MDTLSSGFCARRPLSLDRHERACVVVAPYVLRRCFFRLLRPLWRVALPAACRVSGVRPRDAGLVCAGPVSVPAAQPVAPNVAPTKRETLQAFASVLILTAETLALLMPASIVAIVAGKGGCLAFPDPTDPRPLRQKLRLAGVAMLAVVLASLHKPVRVLWLPPSWPSYTSSGIGSRCGRFGWPRWIGRFRASSGRHRFWSSVARWRSPRSFIRSAHGTDRRCRLSSPQRPWAAGFWACESSCIEPLSVVFPAYRAASLCCAGASAARGEALHWSGWAAVALALGVVLWASAEGFLRACGRWLVVADRSHSCASPAVS